MSLVTVIGNYHAGTIPHAKVRRHQADDALKEMEQLVFSRDQYQETIEEQAVEIAQLQTKLEISQNAFRMAKDRADRMEVRIKSLVCAECDSRVMDNGYCMMGHWCGKPLQ